MVVRALVLSTKAARGVPDDQTTNDRGLWCGPCQMVPEGALESVSLMVPADEMRAVARDEIRERAAEAAERVTKG